MKINHLLQIKMSLSLHYMYVNMLLYYLKKKNVLPTQVNYLVMNLKPFL